MATSRDLDRALRDYRASAQLRLFGAADRRQGELFESHHQQALGARRSARQLLDALAAAFDRANETEFAFLAADGPAAHARVAADAAGALAAGRALAAELDQGGASYADRARAHEMLEAMARQAERMKAATAEPAAAPALPPPPASPPPPAPPPPVRDETARLFARLLRAERERAADSNAARRDAFEAATRAERARTSAEASAELASASEALARIRALRRGRERELAAEVWRLSDAQRDELFSASEPTGNDERQAAAAAARARAALRALEAREAEQLSGPELAQLAAAARHKPSRELALLRSIAAEADRAHARSLYFPERWHDHPLTRDELLTEARAMFERQYAQSEKARALALALGAKKSRAAERPEAEQLAAAVRGKLESLGQLLSAFRGQG